MSDYCIGKLIFVNQTFFFPIVAKFFFNSASSFVTAISCVCVVPAGSGDESGGYGDLSEAPDHRQLRHILHQYTVLYSHTF